MMRHALILLILVAGCTHGRTLEEFAPAHNPQGLFAIVSVTGGETTIRGELLAVDEFGLTVLDAERRIISVAYSRISNARFPDAPRLRIGAQRVPGPDKQRELRLLSRYPQGLDEGLRERLLDAYGQGTMREVQ